MSLEKLNRPNLLKFRALVFGFGFVQVAYLRPSLNSPAGVLAFDTQHGFGWVPMTNLMPLLNSPGI